MSYITGSALDRAFTKVRLTAGGEYMQLEPAEAEALLYHIALIMAGIPEEPAEELIQFLTVRRKEEWLNSYMGVESKEHRRGRKDRRPRKPGPPG